MSLQTSPAAVKLSGIAKRLLSEGLITEHDIQGAIVDAQKQKVSLMHWLLEQRLIASDALTRIASSEFGLPICNIKVIPSSNMPLNLISESLIIKHQALPLLKRGKRLFVGISDPMQLDALEEIKFHSHCMVEAVLIERDTLHQAIQTAISTLSSTLTELDYEDLENSEASADDNTPETSSDTSSDDAPVVKFVHTLLLDAIRQGASDIHFEPFEAQYRVRLRLDGILRVMATPPVQLASRIASRLKIMANLDIAEHRIPQDGRLKLRVSKSRAIDFRVSSLPTMFGEKLVLRILDESSGALGIDKLGYEEEQKKLYLEAIAKPYGMVLVTGPTGSGKTVSMYNALNILNTSERNISTVEDPVEIRVDGINQVQQNMKRGMTFAAALRALLRQDPDVIMIGEIRDLETAEIAIKAAQTGHMVLSTLHTNDAAQTISRLMNMGIAPYNITSAITLVIAQRLARRLHSCKQPINLSPQMLRDAGFTQADIDAGLTIYEAKGCDECYNGYKGRVGIFEVMPMIEEIKKIVLQGGSVLQIAEAARNAGIKDLRTSALQKVKDGMTSLTEIDRVTQD